CEDFSNIVGSTPSCMHAVQGNKFISKQWFSNTRYVREADHRLDWAARLRISMGVAYCLEHMHQLNHLLCQGTLTPALYTSLMASLQ
ncbi:hypothetical protein ACJX0J_014551, partial [Zea mays]